MVELPDFRFEHLNAVVFLAVGAAQFTQHSPCPHRECLTYGGPNAGLRRTLEGTPGV
ncbi:hypothetical protein GCM10010423_70220 [Streptomyces levis]|uniref:Uncharacterized protein n=1 Tax=Streptomyces levis TaxID=285566 RepID=A0ABN3P3M9_9ACTN